MTLGEKYTMKCDVYSFAVMMYEMYYRILPFSDLPKNERSQIHVKVATKGLRPTILPDTFEKIAAIDKKNTEKDETEESKQEEDLKSDQLEEDDKNMQESVSKNDEKSANYNNNAFSVEELSSISYENIKNDEAGQRRQYIKLMQECWEQKEEDRPSMTDVLTIINVWENINNPKRKHSKRSLQ